MKVNVYTHERTDSRGAPLANPRPPMVLAYTRYQGEGACVHDVPGPSWDRATKQAIKDHKEKCLGIAPR